MLRKHALIKRRYIRANHNASIDKKFRQEIMVRSKLRNASLKVKTEKRLAHVRQHNYCVNVL